jgi:hypothetical protein
MSFRKFSQTDIVLNTMRAFPHVEFTIYNSKVYFNNTPHQSGAFSDNILHITSSTGGGISLYEYNVDRDGYTTFAEGTDRPESATGLNPLITPYITKDSARASFRTAGKTSYNNEFKYGDVIKSNYPLTASITREFMSPNPGARHATVNIYDSDLQVLSGGAPFYPHFYAIKNRLNHYQYLSEHYVVSSSFSDGWDKSTNPLNIIYIPSIFYGSQLNEGSVVLKYFVSGTLQAELRDTKQNGELVETTGSNIGKVAGVVMYNEGMILLTGSWEINDQELPLVDGTTAGGLTTSKWIYFGAGANDGITDQTIDNVNFASASYSIKFNGRTETQVQTMFAKANRGEANYSNNPTFIEYNQELLQATGSQIYEENPNRRIKNTVSSSFATFDAPFKRQVYISRVAIYDDSKNLIGIATLADPILKEEQQDYTFKIKLDI